MFGGIICHFLFGNLAFHGPFPSEPLLGSLIYWAGLISRISSLAPLYRVVCTLFSRPFLFFLSLLGFGPILLSSPASFVRAFPWAMGLSYQCKAHGLFPWAGSVPLIFWALTKFISIAPKVLNIKNSITYNLKTTSPSLFPIINFITNHMFSFIF